VPASVREIGCCARAQSSMLVIWLVADLGVREENRSGRGERGERRERRA